MNEPPPPPPPPPTPHEELLAELRAIRDHVQESALSARDAATDVRKMRASGAIKFPMSNVAWGVLGGLWLFLISQAILVAIFWGVLREIVRSQRGY